MAREATALQEASDTEGLGETASGAPRKRRAPQGPRRPSPIYIFVSIQDGKPSVAATFRDPRKMAEYFPTAKEEGSELLVVTPE